MRRPSIPLGLSLLTSVATLLIVAPLAAQQPDRQGFWGSIGGGYGTARMTCSNCGDISREGSITGVVVLGGGLSQSLAFGLELDWWLKTINNDPFRLGAVTGIVQWYPVSNLGLFVKGGVGLAYARGDLRHPTSVFVDDSGLGYLAGVGFDFPVGSGLSVTPLVSFYGGNIGDVQNAQGVSFNVVQFMVALTLH